MKRVLFAALALIAVAGAPQVQAQADTPPAASETSTEAANRKVVVDFYEMAFNQHRPTEAARLYIGDRYIQHNPGVPNGVQAFTGYFEGYFRDHPQSHVVLHHVLADGDLVALHLESRETPEDTGRAIVDIFRVENGKIVEHFDVIQTIPPTTANGNTMFAGDKAD
jgi:predicted SnoaL-like aldol condensation-catalyzing enzyme